ncbi:DoxX family protein [Agromyces albus]|uniref:DoxX family membrane protein n=1 Tax=Agromyces albus TaxID=205332 RepID=A0A4Q2L8U0_9MICO|nr:DoxX family membrane protein [Agromyces albus]RXZ73043.1 DoxX family membrane protein [Agromyces albus]
MSPRPGVARSTPARTIGRIALASGLVFAGVSHLFWARREFRAQVPDWVPMDPDAVVVASGVAEIGLGGALLVLPRERRRIGAIVAAFFVAVFPGNLAQWAGRRDAFGLSTDRARFIRLFFQPVLVALAVWSTTPSGSRR